MSEDDIRRQLLDAAESFPLAGRSADVEQRVLARRRHRAAGYAVATGILVAAGIIGGFAVRNGLESHPASPPAAASSSFIGSSWRLTAVAENHESTTIPAEIGARLDLFADGRLFVDNGTNVLSGKFTVTADGFEASGIGSTFVLYGGDDPRRLAAISALNVLAYGNPDGVTPSAAVHDTVVSSDRATLVVQAGSFRLTFARAGAPSTERPDRPTGSGKTN